MKIKRYNITRNAYLLAAQRMLTRPKRNSWVTSKMTVSSKPVRAGDPNNVLAASSLYWDPHQNKKNMASGGLTCSEIPIMNKRDGSRKGL